ncbi:hypothetical protein ACFU5O_11785 [Streptomyces sp. NPDC057445]|uniref:hypothetical protein n=1 Tax=Streptomyces sp. NPDC057445 TaxID=3346136 RepID=UPI00369CF9B1
MAGLPVPVHGVRVRLRHVAGCGPFADITVDFYPPGAGGEPEFTNVVPDEKLPAEYGPALRNGIEEGLGGVAAAVVVTAGRHHEVDSSEFGFKTAGRMAGRAALVAAGLLPAEEAERLTKVTWPAKPGPKGGQGG